MVVQFFQLKDLNYKLSGRGMIWIATGKKLIDKLLHLQI